MGLPWHEGAIRALLSPPERLPHAILLRGPRGIGKLDFAMSVARSLLCEAPDRSGLACGRCSGCTWFDQGNHPDFRLIEPLRAEESDDPEEGREKRASVHIEVGEVRALVDFLNLTTHRGRSRAVVIHPAEALNVSAANALLKSLEEPPPRTCFLLVSHRWSRLLPTIRSRCRQLDVAPPERAVALAWLKAEGVAAPELALAHAGGAPLSAARFGESYWRAREALLSFVESRDPDPLRAAEELKEATPGVVLALIQKWSCDLLLSQAAGRVRYNPDRERALAAIAARLDRLETARFARRMSRRQRIVEHPLNPRLFLEEMLLECAALVRGAGQASAAPGAG